MNLMRRAALRRARLWTCIGLLAVCVAVARPVAAADAPRVVLKDPDGRVVDPFLAAESSAAIVFLFASIDCPVSNRYAPEVQRLHSAFTQKNVAFWMVYPNPSDTPEAAVFGKSRTLDYHGRIDDRFVSLGVERPAATTRDLFEALTSVVGGSAPKSASAPAVGCFIADFVQ